MILFLDFLMPIYNPTSGSVLEKHVKFSEPCTAGNYMTESGSCLQCEENTFSGYNADSCTSCPDDKISDAGSTSEDDCQYGLYFKSVNK